MSKSKKKKEPKVVEKLSPADIERLNALDADYTAEVLENRPTYPDPASFAELGSDELDEAGFDGKDEVVDLSTPDIEKLLFKDYDGFDPDEVEFLEARGSRRKRKSRRRKEERRRKNKRRGGGGGHGRKLPNPKIVAAAVRNIVNRIPVVGNDGNLVFGSFNMEFLTADKARYFLEAYEEIFPRHHVVACSEITQAGLDVIANAIGWTAYASVENNRNQAVGFLVHPRLQVIGDPISYDSVANVQGIANLRPAFRLNLKDTVTDDEFSAVVLHLKSMRGGAKKTGPVRRQQCKKLAEALEHDDDSIFIGGDWNTHLGSTTDTDPLKTEGFRLLYPRDKTATHPMGGRLDGFMNRDTNTPVGRMRVFPFFDNPDITRGLTDHALVRFHWRICTGGKGNDSTCGTVPQPGGPFSTDGDGNAEVDVNS